MERPRIAPRALWYWLPALLWPVAFRIATLLLVSGRPPAWVAGHDKLLHALYFGIMAFLCWRAFRFERRLSPWAAALAAFAVVAAYGGLDEFTQQFRPARAADIRDWFADLAGASHVFLLALGETVARRGKTEPAPIPCPEI